MRTRSTLAAAALLVGGALLGWLTVTTTAQDKKAGPGAKTDPIFTPAQLAERTLQRRAVEAAIWGMPIVSVHARSEKASNWEGGWRVPCVMRWPGVIKPGTVNSEVCAHEDMLPTMLAAVGDPSIIEECRKGHRAGDKNFKVHLDGYNLMPALSGDSKEWPRKEMIYWSDDGDLMALRYDKWKLHFIEQRAASFQVWSEPFVKLRVPLVFDLRSDPFERAQHDSVYYSDWLFRRVFLLVPAQVLVANWIASFKEFPPRQKPATFSIDEVMKKLEEGSRGK